MKKIDEKIDEIRHFFIEKIYQNDLMSKKHKKVCRVLKNIEHLLILISTITKCGSISLVDISIGSASSTIGLKICIITIGTKKYKLYIKQCYFIV